MSFSVFCHVCLFVSIILKDFIKWTHITINEMIKEKFQGEVHADGKVSASKVYLSGLLIEII